MFTPCRDTAIAHSDPSACRVLMQSEADDPAPTDDERRHAHPHSEEGRRPGRRRR